MELIIKWKHFKAAISSFIDDANDLLYTEREFLKKEDCDYLSNRVKIWIKTCENYLKNSFNDLNNEFVIGFRTAQPYSSYLKNSNADYLINLNKLLDELNTKKKTLEYYLGLLSVSDAIIQPKLIDLEVRAQYSRRDIIDLVLDKLYHLYSLNYYPIQHILRGNGIKANKETVNEIVTILEQKGYIRIINNRALMIQLSSKGKKYIEDKRNFDLITRYTSPVPQIQKIELFSEDQKRTIRTEPIYHYYERQYAS